MCENREMQPKQKQEKRVESLSKIDQSKRLEDGKGGGSAKKPNSHVAKLTPVVIAAYGIGIALLAIFLWMTIVSKSTVKKVDKLPNINVAVASPNSPTAQPENNKPADTPFARGGTFQSKDEGVNRVPPPGMVWIPGGAFGMGSPDREGAADEHPQHGVKVNGFYMDKIEVTQAEYEHVMGQNPTHFKDCPNCPAENVAWISANDYCKKLGKRLPTEAEWEYAARAGTQTKYYWGDEMDSSYAWYDKNSNQRTQPVAQKRPNPFGLADMSGNVWEWCADWYEPTYYQKNIIDNPQGPDTGQYRVMRGGSWGYGSYSLRCACRNWGSPDVRSYFTGFRCVR
jgi:formylglycine-generating enzyme